MKTAVVILNYNGVKFLEQFLPGVITHSGNSEVIVADNCSTDNSVAYLQANFPQVRLIQNTSNGGFSAGYNEALRQVKATYYVLLNSDVEVTPNWVLPLETFMDQHPEVAALQPKIKAYHSRDSFEYAGAAGGFLDVLGYPFCRGRLFDVLEADNNQYNNIRPVFWATGACMMVRSEQYWQAGGLDDDFFAHMEEIDLCWRLHHMGHQVYYHGQSTVYHVGGGTLPKNNPRKTYLNFRNGLYMLYKNTPWSQLWWKLPLRLTLDGLAGIKFLFSGGAKDCAAIIKAHLHFYKTAHHFRRKRVQSLAARTHDTKPPLYKSLIVWQHFFLGKKTFQQLRNVLPGTK